MVSMPEIIHKINEKLTMVRTTDKHELRVRIRRLSDGWYFSPAGDVFVNVFDPEHVGGAGNLDGYWYPFQAFFDNETIKTLSIITLPSVMQDLIFEFESYNYIDPDAEVVEVDESSREMFYERHIFGGLPVVAEPPLCVVFGTLKDVSGKPLAGQRVEAYLNKAGFFTHKAGLIGYAASALTDATGSFELPLVVGLDVTISVPIVGFTTRGFVPNLSSVELTTRTLLNYSPG